MDSARSLFFGRHKVSAGLTRRGCSWIALAVALLAVAVLAAALWRRGEAADEERNLQQLWWKKDSLRIRTAQEEAKTMGEAVRIMEEKGMSAEQVAFPSANELKEARSFTEKLTYVASVRALDQLHREILAMNKSVGLWDTIADNVVLGVKTGAEVAHMRLLYARKTWLARRRVPQVVYFSDTEDRTVGTYSVREYEKRLVANSSAELNSDGLFSGTFVGGWEGDKDKNLPGLALMHDFYPHKAFYVLVDDDTYVFLDSLAEVLLAVEHKNEMPLYGGNLFKAPKRIENCFGPYAPSSISFAHGGSGIILNNFAMKLVRRNTVQCIERYRNCWAGDIQVALCFYSATQRTANLRIKTMLGDSPSVLCRKESFFGKPEKEKQAVAVNRWRSQKKPVTFHKFRRAREYLDVARYDRLVAKEVTFMGLRSYLTSRGYSAAQGV